jgi:hypothetical protein
MEKIKKKMYYQVLDVYWFGGKHILDEKYGFQ